MIRSGGDDGEAHRNLVTLELTRRLHAELGRLAADPAVRVLVVTGAGARAFCAKQPPTFAEGPP